MADLGFHRPHRALETYVPKLLPAEMIRMFDTTAPGAALAVLVIWGCPVLATATVLTWHGLRGTDPGPAARQLLKLVELVIPRGRR